MSDSMFNESFIIPRVAAIHDLCGYGNCSLGVAMPVLSAAGIEVCPVPTSALAAHTAFPHYSFADFTPHLEEYLAVWEKINIPLCGAYSGFLGSAEQITIFSKLFDQHPDWKLVVDPCMADHGKRYKTYTDEMCEKMTELCQRADVILPNLTEASILLDKEYKGQNYSAEEAEKLVDELLAIGAKTVILKGIERGDGRIVNAIKGEAIPYEEHSHELLPYKLHGTGDLFASIVSACYFRHIPLSKATYIAGEFLVRALRISAYQEGFEERGVSYEPLLHDIAQMIESELDKTR